MPYVYFIPLWRALFSTNKIGTSLFVVYGRGFPSYLRSLATWRFITLTFCFFFCFLLLTFCLMPIICEVSVALTSDHTLGCTIPRNVVNIFLVFLAYKYDCLWISSGVNSFSNPGVLAVIAKLQKAEIRLCPFSEPSNSWGALAPSAAPLSTPLQ